MNTIYTTQTEFTHNTTPATVEQAWNNIRLDNEGVAHELNTTWKVLKEVKRKNKKFSKVMTSERSKGLTGHIVNNDVEESVVEEVTPQRESTTYSFRQITRDGEHVVKLDIVIGSTTMDEVKQKLIEEGMSLSNSIEFVMTGYQVALSPAEVLSGQETDFTVRQQVQGG